MDKVQNLQIFDTGGPNFDRYTVIYEDGSYVSMSHNPLWPLGFCIHAGPEDIVIGPHLGKRINFEDLPADCQTVVMADLKGE